MKRSMCLYVPYLPIERLRNGCNESAPSDVPLAVKGEVVTPSPFTPLGAKGCGEGAIHATPSAVMCAINDALAPLDRQATEVPASPMRIWNLLRDTGAA